jgi:hypothetical protein
MNPLTIHHSTARLLIIPSVLSVALKANVTANTIATARKFVATSVNTVAT